MIRWQEVLVPGLQRTGVRHCLEVAGSELHQESNAPLARALDLIVEVMTEYEEIAAKVTRERLVFHPSEGVRPYWNA